MIDVELEGLWNGRELNFLGCEDDSGTVVQPAVDEWGFWKVQKRMDDLPRC